MENKDLIIVGSYPNTQKGIEILKSCLESLINDFDLLLSTHYPVDIELQNLINYYIYDIKNDFIKNKNWFFWADYPNFYCESHTDENYVRHDFAVYRQIINGINFAKDYYDSFFYLEGDCIFEKTDIERIKQLKYDAVKENKKAAFFCFPDFISTTVFYSDIKFFVETFPITKTINEYNLSCETISSNYLLENFFHNNLKVNQKENYVLKLENIQPTDYFKNSKLGLSVVNNGETQFNGGFFSDVVRVENTDELALVYVSNIATIYKEPLKLKLNNQLICDIPNGNLGFVIRLYPDSDNFILSIEDIDFKYNKEKILQSKSFVRFK